MMSDEYQQLAEKKKLHDADFASLTNAAYNDFAVSIPRDDYAFKALYAIMKEWSLIFNNKLAETWEIMSNDFFNQVYAHREEIKKQLDDELRMRGNNSLNSVIEASKKELKDVINASRNDFDKSIDAHIAKVIDEANKKLNASIQSAEALAKMNAYIAIASALTIVATIAFVVYML